MYLAYIVPAAGLGSIRHNQRHYRGGAEQPPKSGRVPCPAAHRNLDIAVVIPAYFERNPAIGDGFFTHIIARTILDLATRPLVDSDDEHQSAALLKQSAREPFTLERQLLAFTRLEEVAASSIARVTGAKFVGRIEQTKILSIGTLFVERDAEIHVH